MTDSNIIAKEVKGKDVNVSIDEQNSDNSNQMNTNKEATSKSVKLNKSQKKRLINLIKSESVIWDVRNKSYCNNVLTDKAWDNISTKMNLTKYVCKSSWKSIRSTRKYHLKKQKRLLEQSEPSTNCDDGTSNHNNNDDVDMKWEYASALKFLDFNENNLQNNEDNYNNNENGNNDEKDGNDNSEADTDTNIVNSCFVNCSTATPQTSDNAPEYLKTFFDQIQQNLIEREKRRQNREKEDPFNSFKNKEILLNFGKMMAPLNDDAVLELNIQILSLIQTARNDPKNY